MKKKCISHVQIKSIKSCRLFLHGHFLATTHSSECIFYVYQLIVGTVNKLIVSYFHDLVHGVNNAQFIYLMVLYIYQVV